MLVRYNKYLTNIVFSVSERNLLYLSVIMRAVIGQFSGSYPTVRPAKISSWFCYQTVSYLSPSVLNFYSMRASESLKLSYTLNCVIKRANDLKIISN